MSAGIVAVEDLEECLISIQQDLVLFHVDVFRRDRMLAQIGPDKDTKSVFVDAVEVQDLSQLLQVVGSLWAVSFLRLLLCLSLFGSRVGRHRCWR